MSWRSASERRAHASSVGRATSSTPRRAGLHNDRLVNGERTVDASPDDEPAACPRDRFQEAERRVAVAIAERSRLLLVAPADAPPLDEDVAVVALPVDLDQAELDEARFHRCPLLIAAVRGPSVRGSRRVVKRPVGPWRSIRPGTGRVVSSARIQARAAHRRRAFDRSRTRGRSPWQRRVAPRLPRSRPRRPAMSTPGQSMASSSALFPSNFASVTTRGPGAWRRWRMRVIKVLSVDFAPAGRRRGARAAGLGVTSAPGFRSSWARKARGTASLSTKQASDLVTRADMTRYTSARVWYCSDR